MVLNHENDDMYIEFIFDDDYGGDKSGKCSRKFKSGLFGENEQTPSSETESRGSLNSQVAGAEGVEPPSREPKSRVLTIGRCPNCAN